jgi:spore coat polysaccharide biosynthesis protein SpsF
MTIVVVVQARLGSTRLPGKILLPLGGRPLLHRMLERLSYATVPDAVLVATTTDASDDDVCDVAARAGVACFRGHPTDLLDRHYQAARATRADVIVKVPSDCPLIDPRVVDRVVRAHVEGRVEGGARFDYTSNLHPESYPDGSDVEAMGSEALHQAWREADRPHEREHTTPFLWDQPARFRLQSVLWESGRDLSRSHRVVVDYEEDYEVVRTVFEALHASRGPSFSVGDVADFLDGHPEVRRLNESRFGVNWIGRGQVALRGAHRPQLERQP